MNLSRCIALMALLTLSAGVNAQSGISSGMRRSKGKAGTMMFQGQNLGSLSSTSEEDELLEKSREAGLLTDWHLAGRFGHGAVDISRKFAPERDALRSGQRHFDRSQYELVFLDGTFILPGEFAAQKGVFYAKSSTYLTNGGEWNVYLESNAEAVVFVDGRQVLTGVPSPTGVQRGRTHLESGYHLVMVKFLAQAAPFRVAILPPNSGSHRKNNTPYLKAAPAQEDMLAGTKSHHSAS